MTESLVTHHDAVSEYYKLKNELNLTPEEKKRTIKMKEINTNDTIKALRAENKMLKERIIELEKSPPLDLKAIKTKLQNEIDSLYYKLQAIELLESEYETSIDITK